MEGEDNINNVENNDIETTNVEEQANATVGNLNQEKQAENQMVQDTVENALKEQIKELDDRYKRLFAEFENYKKRTQKENFEKYNFITSDVVSKILPIMDNLQNAANAKTEDIAYQEGVKMVLNQFESCFKSLNVEEIPTVGQTFDPEYHEAVQHIEDPDKGIQEIVQEFRKGYKIGNKVIRHSMVIVAN